MKYAETKLTPWLLLGLLLALSCYDVSRATTTISSGHTDIFEAEYEQVGTNAPTIHLEFIRIRVTTSQRMFC